MQQKLQHLFAASLLTFGSLIATHAQTIATFEDVVLPGTDTTYLETKFPNDGIYTFQSGNALFYGNVSYGAYWGNFNCTNGTDTVNPSYSSTAASIVGSGYNHSSNYGVAFVSTDFMGPDPTATIPVSAKLTGSAAGNKVAGVYYSNAVYAYRYMLNGDAYRNGHYFLKLVMRGYLNNVKTSDSVVVTLADFTDTANITLVNTWKWANLVTLGNVDSVTFDLVSNDTAGGFGINTPAYFAIDNLTTMDGVCPHAISFATSGISSDGATISWSDAIENVAASYEIAVDQSNTLAPSGTSTTATGLTYTASGLAANTQYYAHIRATCVDGGFSDWDTTGFKTQQVTGINDVSKNSLNAVLSPNPAQDFINLNVAVPVSVNIYSLEGKLLLRTANTRQINITALSAGTYFVHITAVNDDSKNATLRFTKNH